MRETSSKISNAANVLGTELLSCSYSPLTGFYRDGFCSCAPHDMGKHIVCSKVTEEFLQYSLAQGNDLITPRPEFRFAGLKPGDRWCLCASRWLEALSAGFAPPVVLESTNEAVLDIIDLATLKAHALV